MSLKAILIYDFTWNKLEIIIPLYLILLFLSVSLSDTHAIPSRFPKSKDDSQVLAEVLRLASHFCTG